MSGFETLGAIAAAGQFIAQSIKLFRFIDTVRSHLKDAPAEIQERLERLESFASIAKQVQNNESLQTPEAAKVLLRCEKHIQKLQSSLEAIKFKAEDPVSQKTWRTLCGLREEAEIIQMFAKLEQEQSLLLLHFNHLWR